MGAKIIGFLEIMLLIVLIVSPAAAVARKPAQTSKTINHEFNSKMSRRSKEYSQCFSPQSYMAARCDLQN